MAITGAQRLKIRTTKGTKEHEKAQRPPAHLSCRFVSFVVPNNGACGAQSRF